MNRRRIGPKEKDKRNGAAAIEMSIVLSLLILIVFATIEFGRAIQVQQILTNTAREGARQAVIPGATDAFVSKTISDYMSSAGINTYTYTLEKFFAADPSASPPTPARWDDDDDDSGSTGNAVTLNGSGANVIGSHDQLRITISATYGSFAWGVLGTIQSNRVFRASVVMRKE